MTTRAERQVRIDRPAEEVFAFLANGANNPSWQPPVIETTQTDPTLGVSTRFHQTMRHPLGFKVPADYQITIYGPGRELALETTSGGPVRPTQRYELTSTPDGGTILRSVIEYHAQGLVRFALPTLALLHPLFAWEASWIDQARDALAPGRAQPATAPQS